MGQDSTVVYMARARGAECRLAASRLCRLCSPVVCTEHRASKGGTTREGERWNGFLGPNRTKQPPRPAPARALSFLDATGLRAPGRALGTRAARVWVMGASCTSQEPSVTPDGPSCLSLSCSRSPDTQGTRLRRHATTHVATPIHTRTHPPAPRPPTRRKTCLPVVAR